MNTFDRVIIVNFLEHIPTDRKFNDDMYRIMKPGGELIINVPHRRSRLAETRRPGQLDRLLLGCSGYMLIVNTTICKEARPARSAPAPRDRESTRV